MQNLKKAPAILFLTISCAYPFSFDFDSFDSFGFDASIQCKGVKTSSFSFGGLLDSLSATMGFCEVSAKEKNIECLNSKISSLGQIGTWLPLGSILRGERTKIVTDGCASPTPNYPNAWSVQKISNNLFSYESNLARECLAMGQPDCAKNSFVLPASIQDAREAIATAGNAMAGSLGVGASGDSGFESGVREKIIDKCDGSSDKECESKTAVSAQQDRVDKAIENSKKITNGEAVLNADASTPSKYYFESSEELLMALPAPTRDEFAAGSRRAMSAEAIQRKVHSTIGILEVEFLHARKNKSAAAAIPVLPSKISQYVSEISSSLDDTSDYHSSSMPGGSM